jgi:hypothetical protein
MAGARRRLVVAAAIAAAVIAVAALGLLLYGTYGHVADGCNRLTAERVGDVRVGRSACVHGVYQAGGVLAEGGAPDAFRLRIAMAPGHTCRFAPGDDVVIRETAIFDDGQTILGVTGCR